jgi:threonine/homoserine/homoserine lactone efflux protein
MNELWFNLLPLVLAMAITPGRLIALILLLHSKRAVANSVAFVGGMASNMLIEGFAFALIFNLTGAFAAEGSDGPPAIVAILFVVIGVLMLSMAAKQIFQKEDEDKAPPDWLAEIDTFTPGKSYKLGLTWLFISPKQWVFTLTAVAVIFAAGMDPLASLFNYLLFILLVLTLFFLLILTYIVLGERAQDFLERLFKWLKQHMQTIVLIVFIGFGLYFLAKGILALAG